MTIKSNILIKQIRISSNYEPINPTFENYIITNTTYEYLPFIKPDNEQINFILRNKKVHMTPYIIGSIKSLYIKEKIIFNHHRITKQIDYITNLYTSDSDRYNIYILSQLYDYPAIYLLKLILGKKYSFHKDKINKLFENTNTNPNIDNIDKENISIAKEIDEYSIVNEKLQLIEATNFEIIVENLLKKFNIKYQTQEDLTKEQILLYGHAVCTPDFLLSTPVLLDGILIKWIDAKNFYGGNSKFLFKKIKDQTKKYIDRYGDGCIIFRHGYSKKLASMLNIQIKCAHIDYISCD